MNRLAGFIVCMFSALLLLSCAAGNKKSSPDIENPYLLQINTHTANGMAAMQQERWHAATRSFSRALASAQLADHTEHTTRSWYNLATALSRAGEHEQAERAYTKAIDLASRYQQSNMYMRSLLALHLLQLRTETLPTDFSIASLPGTLFTAQRWPNDIHLQAARLAQYLNHSELAEKAYSVVTESKAASKNGLLLQAEAHMGLAIMAQQRGDPERANRESEQTLQICRRIGAARLTAHALLLQSGLSSDQSISHDRLERAIAIYRALNSYQDEKKAVEKLLQLAEKQHNSALAENLQLRLHHLEDKLRQ